ncbi:Hypothetical predicted protein [Octopus vulgaris]|uniref:Uncharacterized protein n=1 Tax=Octopus vulgaris TaxID=6645 RepID=A0AA36AY02_OCTVU|nr:Hypothetical predicted protein [Octopus vulgaris]
MGNESKEFALQHIVSKMLCLNSSCLSKYKRKKWGNVEEAEVNSQKSDMYQFLWHLTVSAHTIVNTPRELLDINQKVGTETNIHLILTKRYSSNSESIQTSCN